VNPAPRGAAEAAVEADYTIPERSGETLLVPPMERLAASIALYEPRGGEAVLGVPLDEFRRRTRARTWDLASPGRGGAAVSRPLIVMGHQPVFFHPGVWFKYFLLDRLCGVHGAEGLHCIVDTDATGPIGAAIPAGRDGVRRTTHTLVSLPDDMPLEAAAVPAPDAWRVFADAVRADLATLGVPAIAQRFDAFAVGEPAARRDATTLGGYLDGLRRAYEARAEAPRYADIAVSALAAGREFQAFALHLIQDPAGLRAAYNGCLDAYRAAHRVRSAANPFPNLVEADGRTETPLWLLHGGRRTDLYAAREGDRLTLGSAQDRVAVIPAGPAGIDALAAANVAVRPKAITLTMFARLCLGDLFIHGVGGGRYDRVTDALAERLFGVRPAPYAVATATLHLPIAEGRDPAGERHALARRVMDLRHNPDRHLTSAGPAEQALIDEKWRLIREVETMRPGPDRRAATRRIREINERLARTVAPEIARAEADLAALRATPPAEEILEFRGYPYFLFEPRDVAALVPAPR
jgi:hypothetical protein